MKTFLLTLIGSVALFADTLVLNDGKRYTGSFVNGNARSIVFLDSDTRARRTYDVRDVREIMFGTSTTSAYGADTTDRYQLLQQLHDGVTRAMANTTLSSANRNTLNSSLTALRRAIDRHDPNEAIMLRDLRRPMEDIRYVANSGVLRAEDRSHLLDTIDRIRDTRQTRRETDDIFGTRSRTR